MLRLESRGVEGDRLFAVRDSVGKLGSGKNTRRFRQIDGLLGFQASCSDDIAVVRFPSGKVLSGDSPSIHDALSSALGQSLVLAKEADIPHLDAGPVHLITTSSLEWLRAALPDAGIDARRFRPNIVVEWPEVGCVEQNWIGRKLRVGDDVCLRVTARTERCGMVALAQGMLPRRPSVLKHIAQFSSLKFGVYAQVEVPGTVRVSDKVLVDGSTES